MSIDAATSPTTAPAAPQGDQKAPSKSSDWDFSFHNLLDIINPLEHLPIIGTIYRAITHTHIGVPERIAGDALYGGLWGAVSGVADAAFEAVTGKDFGSTVLAFFTGHHRDTAVAANTAGSTNITPVTVTPARQLPSSQSPSTADGPDIVALQASMSRNGVDSDLAQRALAAYRKSMMLPAMTLPSLTALPAS